MKVHNQDELEKQLLIKYDIATVEEYLGYLPEFPPYISRETYQILLERLLTDLKNCQNK